MAAREAALGKKWPSGPGWSGTLGCLQKQSPGCVVYVVPEAEAHWPSGLRKQVAYTQDRGHLLCLAGRRFTIQMPVVMGTISSLNPDSAHVTGRKLQHWEPRVTLVNTEMMDVRGCVFIKH